MHPKISTYPDIGSFSVLWLLGFACAYALSRWRGPRGGIAGHHIDNIILILLIAAPVGARFVSRVFYMPELSFGQALKLWEGGGLVFYGGLIAGVLSVVTYCLVRKVPMLPLGDVLAPGLLVGLALGRVGCYLAGCCWGDVCASPAQMTVLTNSLKRHQIYTVPALSPENFPLAVQFPPKAGASLQHAKLGLTAKGERSMPVHPVQLYEAVLAMTLGWLLHFNIFRRIRAGEMFWWMGMGYAVIRFPVEFLRADNPPIYGGLTLSQAISLIIGLVCLGFLVAIRLRQAQTKKN